MVPAADPIPALTLVAKQLRSVLRKVSSQTYSLSRSRVGAKIQISRSQRPGGRVSSFVTGATTFLRDRVQPEMAFDAERLCRRMQSHCRSLVNVVGDTPEFCDAIVRALLATTFGIAFDTSGFYMPCGPVFRHATGVLDKLALRYYYAVLAIPPSDIHFKSVSGASAIWSHASESGRSSFRQAAAINYALSRFARFVRLGWKVDSEAARLQHMVAAAIKSAHVFVAFEADSDGGLSPGRLTRIRKLARQWNALSFDDFQVLSPNGDTLFPVV